jgi:epoxyqueuosine reductase
LNPASSQLASQIKEEASRLGFSAVGIAPGSAWNSRRAELTRWISAGLYGPIDYMRRFFERQASYAQQFPELRSIIVLACDYGGEPDRSEKNSEPSGRVARYARGKDYHQVLQAKLERLEQFIQRSAAPNKVRLLKTVDIQPIQERALAEAAGLGFFGKNTCLIRPKGGSFFFLCSLLTDLEIQPDTPLKWDCGNCTICIDACPTDALKKPYQLDAGRCISSLTIELKGPAPKELRPQIGNWIFGCDICQQVCPYNQRAAGKPDPEFSISPPIPAQIPLKELLECRSDAEFSAKYAETPLSRPKRAGLLRNAAIAAGNSKNPNLIDPLEECLIKENSALIRQHAAWALGEIPSKQCHEILQNAAQTEKEPAVQAEIAQAMRQKPFSPPQHNV